MSAESSAAVGRHPLTETQSLIRRLNGVWHERSLQIYMAIVLAHWAEHLAQAFQVYALHWTRSEARGALGLWFPWLVNSETLHYGYAIVMLIGLWVFRRGFVGRSYVWWMVAFWIQFWHHIEHALLQAQVVMGRNLLDSPVPVSIVQLWVPRVELHLIYNTAVFIPMVIGIYQHMLPTRDERTRMKCTCAIVPQVATAAA